MRRAWTMRRLDFLYTQASTLLQWMLDCIIDPVMWIVWWYVMGSFWWERPLFLVLVVLASLSARGALQLRWWIQGNRDEGDYTFNIVIETLLLVGDIFLILSKEVWVYDWWFLLLHCAVRAVFIILTSINIVVLLIDMRKQWLFPFFDTISYCLHHYQKRQKSSQIKSWWG